MLKWILEHIGVVAVAVVFLVQIVRGLLQAAKTAQKRQAIPDELAAERRTREVQEQIRRQIAERRGHRSQPAAEPPPLHQPMPPPVPRTETTQMPELFGGPLGRMLEELQKKVQPQPAVVRSPTIDKRHAGELERQQRLADELQAVEDTRRLAQRRAKHHAADLAAEAQTEPALRSVAREHVLSDLRDPTSLRRAVVLREVLGPPIGLR
jgi:hypothetical protein